MHYDSTSASAQQSQQRCSAQQQQCYVPIAPYYQRSEPSSCFNFKTLASVCALAGMLVISLLILPDMKTTTLGDVLLMVACVVVPIVACTAVVLAHITKKAWLYWPFMVYAVLVIAVYTLGILWLLLLLVVSTDEKLDLDKAERESLRSVVKRGLFWAFVVFGLHTAMLLVVAKAHIDMREELREREGYTALSTGNA